MHDFKALIHGAFTPNGQTLDADVLEELAQHAASTYETARAEGCDAAEAAARVGALIAAWRADARRLRRRPGRPAVVSPPPVEGRAWTGLGQDVKYGIRLLRRQPGFALVVMLTMALGIGATTTLFSITYGVLLKPLPWPDADRLVRVSESRQGHEPRVRGTITNAAYLAWHAQPTTIDAIGGWLIVPSPAARRAHAG
jgi:hypothetical protein